MNSSPDAIEKETEKNIKEYVEEDNISEDNRKKRSILQNPLKEITVVEMKKRDALGNLTFNTYFLQFLVLICLVLMCLFLEIFTVCF